MGKVWKWGKWSALCQDRLCWAQLRSQIVGEVISVVVPEQQCNNCGSRETEADSGSDYYYKDEEKKPQFVLTADVEKIQRKWEEEGQVW